MGQRLNLRIYPPAILLSYVKRESNFSFEVLATGRDDQRLLQELDNRTVRSVPCTKNTINSFLLRWHEKQQLT